MFTKAIVRTPCRALVNGLSSANLGPPDYHKALLQHADYIETLKECGLQVTVLPADESFPDSTFVEDVALMREVVGQKMGVKASGGIKDWSTAAAMVKAGANRIGTSSGIVIVENAPESMRSL